MLGEGERRPAEIHHLALAAKPLHAEWQLGPRCDQDPQVGRGEPDERFDESPRDGRTGEDVDIVEDEEHWSVEDLLDRVRQEGGRRVRPAEDAGVVGGLDRALDGSREIRWQIGQGDPQGRDDPGGQGAEVAIARVERVPGRAPAGGHAGGERRLAEPGAAHDDGQPAIRATRQALLEDGPAQRADRVGRRQQLGRAPDRGPLDRRVGSAAGAVVGGGRGRSIGRGGQRSLGSNARIVAPTRSRAPVWVRGPAGPAVPAPPSAVATSGVACAAPNDPTS